MFRHFLTLILTTLIAIQTSVSMADVHESIELAVEHVILNNAQQQSDNAQDVSSNFQQVTDISYKKSISLITDLPFDDVGNDCQHCQSCQNCHGLSQMFMSGQPQTVAHFDVSESPLMYNFQYNSLLNSPDNPPPIH